MNATFRVVVRICLVWLFGVIAPLASADVLISNLPGNDGTGTYLNGDGHSLDNSKAAGFIMPAATDYSLEEVVLRLEILDLANNPVVQIWNDSGGLPGSSLMTLSNPMFTVGGIASYSFTPPSQLTLQATQTYWVVVYNDSPGDDRFEWYANSPVIAPTGLATDAGYLYSTGPPPPVAPSSYFNSYEVSGFPTSGDAAVWGSFDDTRINYAGGVLTTGAYTTLRSVIASAGATLAPPTPALTPGYLATVDVFFTSLLSTTTGTLSAAEQTALHDWIGTGGTLIVTGDVFPLAAYESFTSFYGVTGYVSVGFTGTGTVLSVHPLTTGVTGFDYGSNCTFSHGSDALLLADDGFGHDFLVVLEPASGFSAGGRIAVFGDHNLFTDSMIGLADNLTFATNLVHWAGNAPAVLPFSDGFESGDTSAWSATVP